KHHDRNHDLPYQYIVWMEQDDTDELTPVVLKTMKEGANLPVPRDAISRNINSRTGRNSFRTAAFVGTLQKLCREVVDLNCESEHHFGLRLCRNSVSVVRCRPVISIELVQVIAHRL